MNMSLSEGVHDYEEIHSRNSGSLMPAVQHSNGEHLINISEGNHHVVLQVRHDVYKPSDWARAILRHLSVGQKKISVADIGTGSGVLGIAAAKAGAKVYATDTAESAVVQTRVNARLNEVEMEVVQGEYFAGTDQKFDLVVANLPQELVAIPEELTESLQTSIPGGEGGNEIVIEFLRQAVDHLQPEGKILFPLSTLSFYRETLEFAKSLYSVELHAQETVQAKGYVDSLPWLYETLNHNGLIRLYKTNNVWTHDLDLYLLRPLDNAS